MLAEGQPRSLENVSMLPLKKEHLLAEVEDVLRSMPPPSAFGRGEMEPFAWLGRAMAVLQRWSASNAMQVTGAADELRDDNMSRVSKGYVAVLTMLQQARADLRLDVGPMATVVDHGAVFDYFDEVRKILQTAKTNLLFIDPYLDADFVPRYLAHVGGGVSIRLLTEKKLTTLLPAVDMFVAQHHVPVAVRSCGGLHDRLVFVDRSSCYISGASFKDGGKNAPALLAQILDGFGALASIYEAKWAAGKVERQ